MRLLTLGGLAADGLTYRREKPLLLLAYLALEGTQTRKHLAELFWPEAANPMNSLAQNLIRLRPLGSVVRENDKWVEPQIECDATDFRTHHKAGRTREATATYRGAFLDGIREGLNADLEEWLLDTRTALGAEARAAHLTLAEHHHARNEPADAARHAELAYGTPGADPIDPEDLPRVWRLLGRPDHPLAVTLRRDAVELGLSLPTTPQPAPAAVTILGRQTELERLAALKPGQVAWISGPPGIGKSALLGALAALGDWRILPGVNGLPLGTLEPLSPHPLGSTADALNTLRDTRLKVAIDGWEDCDDTTRAALTLAARQHPGATLVIAARQPPAVPVEQHLPLHPLSELELNAHPGAHAATGGHPTLLNAFLSGTPADRSLDAHLTHLGPTPRRLFLALAAQDTPHLNATRAALNLSAGELAGTLDQLTREGLTTPTGTIRATTPARDLLDAQPLDTALLHLHLARAHPKDSAWPHWLKAKDLWETTDEQACATAAHWYAKQEMKRGYPAKAARTLEVAPRSMKIIVSQAWSLIHAGRFREVGPMLEGYPDYSDLMGVKGMSLVLLGKNLEASAAISRIELKLDMNHAIYEEVLGHIARRCQDNAKAKIHYAKSLELWRLNGMENEACIVESILRFSYLNTFDEAQKFFEDFNMRSNNSCVQAVIKNNFGRLLIEYEKYEESEPVLKSAVDKFDEIDNLYGLSIALNNLGMQFHHRSYYKMALECYQKSFLKAVEIGDIRQYAILLRTIAEIKNEKFTLQMINDILGESGNRPLADEIWNNIIEGGPKA
ncbi:hypothetical protein E7T09_14990 [Deinococcus sp. KSM4-11]|uniref:hypothetical protein n=1 Tax=Deinococcus sp. KSM4-11 TaxID=2568654 RepID=UPI0010A3C198|nr:hypothetical protein [Deinococcus sp. KSM4-11]THF85822.1 hypothetical protein E7T09_14990 [Deinococcus sp. KSM4-11]